MFVKERQPGDLERLRSMARKERHAEQKDRLLASSAKAWRQLNPQVLRSVCACPYLEHENGR